MEIIVVGSGSKGNSTIIGNKEKFIIIDVGISFNEIDKSISKYGYDINKVLGVIITHKHHDHDKFINQFDSFLTYGLDLKNEIKNQEVFFIDEFEIIPFQLSHDVKNFGFIIKYNEEELVYITDSGYIKKDIKEIIKNKKYYLIESNHDIKMLVNSNRPGYIKNRILSDEGHLSNGLASQTLCEVIGENTREIFFMHLSSEANNEKKVIKTFLKTINENKNDIKKIELFITKQEKVVSNIKQ